MYATSEVAPFSCLVVNSVFDLDSADPVLRSQCVIVPQYLFDRPSVTVRIIGPQPIFIEAHEQ